MADDTTSLPIKSLQLPSKTVGKLKQLGLRTVGDLYALPLPKLIEVGLVLRELEELAEAASDFGVTWHSKEAIASSGATTPTPTAKPKQVKAKAAPATAKSKATASRAKGELLPDLIEALELAKNAPQGLKPEDLDAFAPYVDATGMHFQSAPPSARHLARFRRAHLGRTKTIDGPERWFVAAFADLSSFPPKRIGEIGTFMMHLLGLFDDLLTRAGVEILSRQRCGSAATFTIAAKSEPKARRIVEAYESTLGSAPAVLDALPPELVVFTAAGLRTVEARQELVRLKSALTEAASGLSSVTALEAVRYLAEAYGDRPTEGVTVLRAVLDPQSLARVPRNDDCATALVEAARLCVAGGAPALAIELVTRAVAVEAREAHITPLRSELVNDATFAPLHREPSFRSLFRGFPAFEAKLAR